MSSSLGLLLASEEDEALQREGKEGTSGLRSVGSVGLQSVGTVSHDSLAAPPGARRWVNPWGCLGHPPCPLNSIQTPQVLLKDLEQAGKVRAGDKSPHKHSS